MGKGAGSDRGAAPPASFDAGHPDYPSARTRAERPTPYPTSPKNAAMSPLGQGERACPLLVSERTLLLAPGGRWCTMKACGNRNKTRAYRSRQAG